MDNVEILYRPFDFSDPAGFENSSYLHALNDSARDIIVIDGQDHTFRERRTCFYHAERFVRKNQYIVVDDF